MGNKRAKLERASRSPALQFVHDKFIGVKYALMPDSSLAYMIGENANRQLGRGVGYQETMRAIKENLPKRPPKFFMDASVAEKLKRIARKSIAR